MYRRLQKENIPFAAGILYPNDMDYALARLLAEEVVLEQPFLPIGDTAYQRALDLVGSCGQVIYCGAEIGTINRRILDLVEAARAAGKLVNAAEGQLPDPGQFQQQATACDSVRKELP